MTTANTNRGRGRSKDADTHQFVALLPLGAGHTGGVHIAGHVAQGPHGGLFPRRVLERVPAEERTGVLPGDLVNVGVAATGTSELVPGELG
jgi:hypothetical protein